MHGNLSVKWTSVTASLRIIRGSGFPNMRCSAMRTVNGLLLMTVPTEKLGVAATQVYTVVNIKAQPEQVGALRQQAEVFPAYHMNKEHWVSVRIDGSLPEEWVLQWVDDSYRLTQTGVGGGIEKNVMTMSETKFGKSDGKRGVKCCSLARLERLAETQEYPKPHCALIEKLILTVKKLHKVQAALRLPECLCIGKISDSVCAA